MQDPPKVVHGDKILPKWGAAPIADEVASYWRRALTKREPEPKERKQSLSAYTCRIWRSNICPCMLDKRNPRQIILQIKNHGGRSSGHHLGCIHYSNLSMMGTNHASANPCREKETRLDEVGALSRKRDTS